jgi:hypothetical protein
VQIHIENAFLVERYQVEFTPTILILTPDGKAHKSSTGFLPPDEYMAYVSLGRGKTLLDLKRFDDAIAALEEVPSRWPKTDAAPEALYWLAVAKYKKTGEGGALSEIWKRVNEGYKGSIWAKKISFLFEGEAKPGEARERAQRQPGKKT